MRGRKRCLAKFLIFSIMLNASAWTNDCFANLVSKLESEKNKIVSKIKKNKEKILSAKKYQRNIEKEKSNLEFETDQISKSVYYMEIQIREQENKINELEEKKAEKEEEKEHSRDKLGVYIRAIYLCRIPNVYEIIFTSESFDDFVDKSQVLSIISKRMFELINEINNSIQSIDTCTKDIKKIQFNNEITIERLKKQKRILESKVNELDNLYEESKKNQKQTENELHANDAELAKKQAEINEYYETLKKKKESEAKERSKSASKSKNYHKNEPSNGPYIPKITNDGLRLLWPVEGFRHITSHFGDTEGRGAPHGAIDIGSNYTKNGKVPILNKSVRAPTDMVILYSGWCGGYGKLIIGGFEFNGKSYHMYFGHLNHLIVSKGENVKMGDPIGFVGSTGQSTGPHLHFEIRVNGQRVNPESFTYNY